MTTKILVDRYLCDKCKKEYGLENEADTCPCKTPELLEFPVLGGLRQVVEEYIVKIVEDGYPPKDSDHYIFEAAVEAFYGKGVWDWVNAHSED